MRVSTEWKLLAGVRASTEMPTNATPVPRTQVPGPETITDPLKKDLRGECPLCKGPKYSRWDDFEEMCWHYCINPECNWERRLI